MPRLGQLLVRADLVSENNLARALGVQHFAGGRIGTLLLERGSVTEDDIGKMLSRQHGCEYVPWASLADVDPLTIALLPARFAIKHGAVPYDRLEGVLKLALRDPADLRILDELFFVTGRKILAGVAPEVRIYQALEKYYGERRTPRFAILAEKLSRPARGGRSGFIPPPPPPQFFPERSAPSRLVPEAHEIWGDSAEPDFGGGPPIIQSWKVPDLDGGWAGGSTSRPAQTARSSQSPSPSPRSAPKIPDRDLEPISWDEMPPGMSWAEMPAAPALWTFETAPSPVSPSKPVAPPQAISPAAEFSPATRVVPPKPGQQPEERLGPRAVREAPSLAPEVDFRRPPAVSGPGPIIEGRVPTAADFARVAGATDRDEIAAAALSALGRRFASAAIFAARPDVVAGWAAAGKVDAAAIRAVKIAWSEPSVFLNVRLSRSFYLGPLLNLPRHEELGKAFPTWPEECAVQPVLIKEKPAAFLFVDSPRDGVTPMDLVYLRELAGAMGSAFAAAIRLRKKEI